MKNTKVALGFQSFMVMFAIGIIISSIVTFDEMKRDHFIYFWQCALRPVRIDKIITEK